MLALITVQAAATVRSARWIPAAVTYLALLAAVYATDAGPAYGAYAFTAAALLPVAAWLTVPTLALESEAGRHVVAVAVGGQHRVQVGWLAVAAGQAWALAVVAVVWGLIANRAADTPAEAGVGLAVHAGFGVAGVGVGALFGRPLTRHLAVSVVGIACVITAAVVWQASPVNAVVRAMQLEVVDRTQVGTQLGLLVLLGLGALLASVWASWRS